MLVLGAKGHAIEILQLLEGNGNNEIVYFFDDVNMNLENILFSKYVVVRSLSVAIECIKQDPRVVIGIGNPHLRKRMSDIFVSLGGKLYTVIDSTAYIGNHSVVLDDGLNIMHGVFISNDVTIREGSLINARAMLHHNVCIEKYCEIGPGAQLLGHVYIGKYTQIGAGAIILPRVRIGERVVVGAGAVVTVDVPANTTVVGVPARSVIKS